MRRDLLVKLGAATTKWGAIAQANASSMRDALLGSKSAGRLGPCGGQKIPDHFHEHYLFRQKRGILTGEAFRRILQQKLAPHLLHEGKPYRLTAHQFRHSIATEMIDRGIDIYTVKEFLGHKSLQMTERYVQIYLKSRKREV